jgi:hypothetical protein
MSSTPQTEALEAWLKQHGALLHPAIQIVEDAASGVHVRATKTLPPGTTIGTAPHAISLSYLNALVDEQYPVFSTRREQWSIEAIGFFYLMTQYINRENSLWKPYLDLLPGPESSALSQPLFFDDTDDVEWLADTDVWYTVLKRKEKYEALYQSHLPLLEQAGIDTRPYTW